MKPQHMYSLLSLVVIGSLLLAACGADTTSTPVSIDPVSDIYTAAALTMISNPALATATPLAPATTTPWPTTGAASNVVLSLSTPTSYVSNSSAAVSTCDNSVYVSDVTIPDGTEIAAGETFTKTWAIENIGTCTWTTDYTIVFLSGDEMDGSSTALTESVAPYETIYVSVEMTAPSTTGDYVGYWKLANADSTGFGASVYVMITVTTASTSTPTLTPTSTTEVSSTSTATPTTAATSTATDIPTSTPIPEPTATVAEATVSP